MVREGYKKVRLATSGSPFFVRPSYWFHMPEGSRADVLAARRLSLSSFQSVACWAGTPVLSPSSQGRSWAETPRSGIYAVASPPVSMAGCAPKRRKDVYVRPTYVRLSLVRVPSRRDSASTPHMSDIRTKESCYMYRRSLAHCIALILKGRYPYCMAFFGCEPQQICGQD